MNMSKTKPKKMAIGGVVGALMNKDKPGGMLAGAIPGIPGMLLRDNRREREEALILAEKKAKQEAAARGQVQKKAKGGKISEYGGKEMYKSKSAMMKHEGKESMAMEKKEARMAMGGKCRGMGAATKGGNYKG